jgi:imidazolonepropionase-like amidohydrolase
MKSKLILLLAVACCLTAVRAEAQTYAITNARIVTVAGASIDKGTVVMRNGLIDSVGANIKVPADAVVIDGSGFTVYPGFIDALTNLGVQAPTPPRPAAGAPQVPGAAQQATPTSNSNYPAGLRPEDSVAEDLKAGEAQFEAARNAGFTTVLTVNRTGIFNGKSAVIDLAGDSVSEMVIRAPFAEHFSYATLQGQYPGSLLGTFSAFRQMMLDAQRLQTIEKNYAANPRGMKRPEPDKSLEALFPIVNRQMPLVINANTENEINRSLDLAKELNFKLIIAGGQEAWKSADRLKAQDVPVLLSLNFPKRTATASSDADPETMDVLRFRAETPRGPARLAQAGVRFAFQSGGATSLADFFTNASKSVEAGLSQDAAIRAMTLGSAEILGVSDRLGSIETGKIANVVMVKNDVFAKDRFVSRTFVDGKMFEQKEPARRPANAAPTATTVSTPAVMTVAGNYTVTIDVPGQTLTGTLALVQQGAVLTGSLTTQLGVTQIRDGKVAADGFTFSGSVDYGGSQIEIVVKGAVTGNQISGTIDSPQGTISYSGTRNP